MLNMKEVDTAQGAAGKIPYGTIHIHININCIFGAESLIKLLEIIGIYKYIHCVRYKMIFI